MYEISPENAQNALWVSLVTMPQGADTHPFMDFTGPDAASFWTT